MKNELTWYEHVKRINSKERLPKIIKNHLGKERGGSWGKKWTDRFEKTKKEK